MTAHGARPVWMSYVGVDGVDSTVEQIEAKRGSTLMPAHYLDTIGRIAVVADPRGAEFALDGDL